jgi:hypothetical protein
MFKCGEEEVLESGEEDVEGVICLISCGDFVSVFELLLLLLLCSGDELSPKMSFFSRRRK